MFLFNYTSHWFALNLNFVLLPGLHTTVKIAIWLKKFSKDVRGWSQTSPSYHTINVWQRLVCRHWNTDILDLTSSKSTTLYMDCHPSVFTYFSNSVTTIEQEDTLKLHKHSVRTDLRQHFFTERIINVWNKLDEDTVSATSLNSFKRRLQKMYSDVSFPRLT